MMKSLNSDFPYSQTATLVVHILHQWLNKPMASTLSLSSLSSLLYCFLSVLGMETRASHMLGKHSTKLHISPTPLSPVDGGGRGE